MAIDTSMYQNTGDISGGLQRGLSMRDMIDQRNMRNKQLLEQEKIRAAYGKAVGPDGSFNQGALLSEIAQIAPEKVPALKQQFTAQQAEADKLKREKTLFEADMISRVAPTISDQSTYEAALAQLGQSGIDVSQMPKAYDPSLVNRYSQLAIDAKTRLAQQNADRTFNLQKEELEIKRNNAKSKSVADTTKAAMDLRKERSALPTTKATMEVSAAYNKIQSASAKPSAAGDLSLIFNYMKMLDPNSVVRESEFRSAEQARAWLSKAEDNGIVVPAAVKQGIQKLENGQFLLPEQRADFVNQAGGLYQSQMDIQNQVDAQFSEIARKSGIDPQDVIVRFDANTPKSSKPKTVIQNGFTYTLNEKTGKYE